MTHKQKRLRRESNDYQSYVPFSERTCDDNKIKLTYYGTIQDILDYESSLEEKDD